MSATVLQPGLREVRLHGPLGKLFGRVHRLAVSTPREAAMALCAVLPGFRAAFLGPGNQARYHVLVGRGAARYDIDRDEVDAPMGRAAPIAFVPIIGGAKKGWGKVILGAVLVVVGFYTGQGWLVKVGASLMLGGVSQLLSPQRQGGAQQRPEDTPGYAFDSIVNTTQQGLPVPVAFGRVLVGSAVISAGLSTDDVVIPAPPPPPPPPPLPPYEPGDYGLGGDGGGF